MLWYYISHLSGRLFTNKRKLSSQDLYCDECGDYDIELGQFENDEEAKKAHIKYLVDYLGYSEEDAEYALNEDEEDV